MCSRTLKDTETRYSNIERECLAVKFVFTKFEYYLMGGHTAIETYHSPLEQIVKENIADVLTQLQSMTLWCLRFDITVKYKPGIKILVADALSSVCLQRQTHEPCQKEISFISNMQLLIEIQRIKDASLLEAMLNQLKETVDKGWPPLTKSVHRSFGYFGISDAPL